MGTDPRVGTVPRWSGGGFRADGRFSAGRRSSGDRPGRRCLVTGDAARNKEQCLPGGGSATVRIVLPAAWDKLMAARGYEPLKKYMLSSDLRPDVPRPKVRGYSRPGVRGDVGGRGGRERRGFRPRRDFRR